MPEKRQKVTRKARGDIVIERTIPIGEGRTASQVEITVRPTERDGVYEIVRYRRRITGSGRKRWSRSRDEEGKRLHGSVLGI